MDNRWYSKTKGSYTAVAKTPWLKALALYAKGDAWHGGGLFSYDHVYWLNDGWGHEQLQGSDQVKRNKSYQPKDDFGGECLHVYYNRLQRDGWELIDRFRTENRNVNAVFERATTHGWVLRKICHEGTSHPVGKGVYWDEHVLVNEQGETFSQPDWEWAEWMDGAIVFAALGQLYRQTVTNQLELNQAELIHDFNDYRFTELKAPY